MARMADQWSDPVEPAPRVARVSRGHGGHSALYQATLQSPRWRTLRKMAALRSEPRWPRRPPRCEWCRRAGGPDCPLSLHHRHGWGQLGLERLRDVWLLCSNCHVRADSRLRRRQQARGATPHGIRWTGNTGARTPEGASTRRGLQSGEGTFETVTLTPGVSPQTRSQGTPVRSGRGGSGTPGPLVLAGGSW